MKAVTYMRFALLIVGAGLAVAQTRVDLRSQTKSVDFTSAETTKPFKSGIALPVSCSSGEVFFKSDEIPGWNIHLCAPANHWIQLLGLPATGGSTAEGAMLQWSAARNQWESSPLPGVAIGSGSGTPAGTCTAGQSLYLDISKTPRDLWFCETSGNWKLILSTTPTGPGEIVVTENDSPTTPDSGRQTFFFDPADHHLKRKDAAGIVKDLEGFQLPLAFTPENSANKGAGDGYAALDSDGKIPPAQLPGSVSQTNQSNTYTAGAQDFTAVPTLPFQSGTAANLPISCAQGQTYFATNATPGQNLYFCTTPNVWSQQAVVQTNRSNTYTSGTQNFTGVPTLPFQAGSVAGLPAGCAQGQTYFATDATPGQNLYFCTASNVWTQQLNSARVAGTGSISLPVGARNGTTNRTAWNYTGASLIADGASGSETQTSLSFADAAENDAAVSFIVPQDWTGTTVSVALHSSNSSGTQTGLWHIEVSIACVGNGESVVPAYNPTTEFDVAPVGANKLSIAVVNGVSTANCSTGERAFLKVKRLGTHVNDTATVSFGLMGAEIRYAK